MSPLPPDQQQHFFISKNNNNLMINNKMDSGRIDLLLGLALHTPAAALSSLSPATVASGGVPQQQQPSLTLSLLFPSATQQQQQNMSSNCDDISSYSNSFVSVKRERTDDQLAVNNTDLCEDDDVISNTAGSGRSCRKRKLRLNKKQSALLEDSFKLHTTLNPKQKEALAMQLNLRPRQVEVWFQNRRARTKLKQTEVDCEFLKKCCERLAEENEKLHKELQQLKSLNKRQHQQQQQPLYMHHLLPTSSRLSTTSTTSYMMQYYCPSCHQHQQQVPPNNNPSSSNFLISSKKGIIFNPFTKAACLK